MEQSFWDYLITAPQCAQQPLLCILTYIESVFPHAEQRIFHGLPSFFYGRRDFINIGAHKDHFTLYLVGDGRQGLQLFSDIKRDFPRFTYTKSTLQIPYTEPFPFILLAEICLRLMADMDM